MGTLNVQVEKSPGISLSELMGETKAGTRCGACVSPSSKGKRDIYLVDLIRRQVTLGHVEQEDYSFSSYCGRIFKVEEIFETKIRPLLRKDGGDAELVSLDEGKILFEYHGACAPCPSSKKETLAFIQETLNKALGKKDIIVDFVE